VQSAAGKESRNRTALKRCTNTEACWNKKLASLASPELAEILLPSSFKRRRAEKLKTPRVFIIIIIVIIIVVVVVVVVVVLK